MDAPLVTHLRHAAIAAPDRMERQLSFYRGLLGPARLTPTAAGLRFPAADGPFFQRPGLRRLRRAAVPPASLTGSQG